MNVENETKKLAKILVDYSVNVKTGEFVQIKYTGPAKLLVDEIVKLVSLKGAYPFVTTRHDFVKYAPTKALSKPYPLSKEISQKIDCLINIDDEDDLYKYKNLDNKRINTLAIANQETHSHIINNKRWCLVRYPTPAYAVQAGMSNEDYANYAFKTMNIDWKKKTKEMIKLKKLMEKTDIVRIVGYKTDLTFSIKNRISSVCDGHYNMPDGEVFTAPVKETTNGKIFYPVAFYNNKKFEDIELEFKNGRVINFKVKNNKKEFEKILNADNNARYLGELGIGRNNEIKKIIGDILFDEKIGGTIHLALGAAYHENFKEDLKKMSKEKIKELTNQSVVHWDMILKPSDVYFDGKKLK